MRRKLSQKERDQIRNAKNEYEISKMNPKQHLEGRRRILDRIVGAKRVRMNVKLTLMR